jgi:hypothetical protein
MHPASTSVRIHALHAASASAFMPCAVIRVARPPIQRKLLPQPHPHQLSVAPNTTSTGHRSLTRQAGARSAQHTRPHPLVARGALSNSGLNISRCWCLCEHTDLPSAASCTTSEVAALRALVHYARAALASPAAAVQLG